MSFILDALKKSETDRQQRGSAEFAGVPTSTRREGPPRWLWVVGLLLAVNLVVLIGLLLRPDTTPELASVTVPVTQTVENRKDNFAEQVAAAKQNAPARAESLVAAVETPQESAPSPTPVVAAARTTVNTAALPTIHEVRANGIVTLPDLHVDVHVYSEKPEERFVFVNMNKHNEGSHLAEGPLVQEITRDGVVLNQNGTTFFLPRD